MKMTAEQKKNNGTTSALGSQSAAPLWFFLVPPRPPEAMCFGRDDSNCGDFGNPLQRFAMVNPVRSN